MRMHGVSLSRVAPHLPHEIQAAEHHLVFGAGNVAARADVQHDAGVALGLQPLLQELDADAPPGSRRRDTRSLRGCGPGDVEGRSRVASSDRARRAPPSCRESRVRDSARARSGDRAPPTWCRRTSARRARRTPPSDRAPLDRCASTTSSCSRRRARRTGQRQPRRRHANAQARRDPAVRGAGTADGDPRRPRLRRGPRDVHGVVEASGSADESRSVPGANW